MKASKEIHAIPDSENTREVALPAGRVPVEPRAFRPAREQSITEFHPIDRAVSQNKSLCLKILFPDTDLSQLQLQLW